MLLQRNSAAQIMGKTIYDSYGRVYGRIFGHSNSPTAPEDNSIWIERSDGDFETCQNSQLNIEGDSIIITTSWITRSNQINEELSTILRKISALNKLNDTDEITEEVYHKLQEKYKTILRTLTNRHQHEIKKAKQRLETLKTQQHDIELLLATLKIESSVEHHNTETHDAFRTLNSLLNRTMKERTDIENVLSQLTETMTPEFPTISHRTASIQPILLRIREAEV